MQLHVQESSDGQQTMQQLSETYPGTLPQLLYDIEISYTDIRTGEAYQPMTMISLAFPVPEGYESLTKPRILRSAEDSFMELTPQMQEDGTFYLDSARTLTHLIVADFPAGLQGISLNSSSIKINRGQKHTLKVVPIPESVTENYNVTWKSSNTSIAKVSKKGVVTAVKNGKATITATVAEHPEMTRQEAFAESKQMMDGNKWDAFVLDLSFIGWTLLGVCTFGILLVFYVEPYIYLTRAELYHALKNK